MPENDARSVHVPSQLTTEEGGGGGGGLELLSKIINTYVFIIFATILTLAYISDHTLCCGSAASPGRSLHLIISQLRTKYTLSNCPNHFWGNIASSQFAQLRTKYIRRTHFRFYE